MNHPFRNLGVVFLALSVAGFQAHATGAESIVIARSLALSGPLQSYGEAKRDGGDAFIAKVNKAGGVNGRLIKVTTLDDAYDPKKTVANMRTLASELQPTAFLGLFGVPTIAAALPIISELQVPVVGLTSGAAAVRKPHNPLVFPVRASYADEARKLVSQIQTLGVTRIAMIYTDNPFGESVRDNLLAALKDAQLESKVIKMDAAGAGADKAIAEMAVDEPQCLFVVMLSGPAIKVIDSVKKSKSRPLLYTFSTVDTTSVQKALGEKASGLAITQIVPIPSGQQFQVAYEYMNALTELGRGSTPSFYGLEAYVEAKILVEGLRRSGPSITRGNLVKALEGMGEYDAGGYYVSYRPGDHSGSRFVDINVIDREGRLRR